MKNRLKLKNLNFKIEEIEKIESKKIRISEIITSEINFQNFNEIMQMCALIEFEDYFHKLRPRFEKGNVGFSKEESDKSIKELIEYIIKSKSKEFNKPLFAKKFFRSIVRNLYRAPIHDKEKMYGTIRLELKLRHKIVHQATDIGLPHKVFHLGLFLSIMHFCSTIQEIYNIKKDINI